jgi:hypothetical protein
MDSHGGGCAAALRRGIEHHPHIDIAVLFGFMRDVCAGRETGRQQQPCS